MDFFPSLKLHSGYVEQLVENGMCIGENYAFKTGLSVVLVIEELVIHLIAPAAIEKYNSSVCYWWVAASLTGSPKVLSGCEADTLVSVP